MMSTPPLVDLSLDTHTVSEFVYAAKSALEASVSPAWVVGEIVNFTCAASGHWYFVLRDERAQVDCVMLVRENRKTGFTPANGDKVTLYGTPTLYAPRGRFQLAVRQMRPDGVGRLYQLFLQRKEGWRARGWFDNCRSLPFLPQRVGVVCSLRGAALHDVLRTLRARLPAVSVVLYPAPAQGQDAAAKIGEMIHIAGQRRECDVLLVCRGGGGIEDLWAYNEEAVVAAIAGCPIPVITGIGHEVDETLADYAADVRSPTPTAAAAAAVPNAADICQQLDEWGRRLHYRLAAGVEERMQRLDWARRLIAAPNKVLAEKTADWRRLSVAKVLAADSIVGRCKEKLSALSYRLRYPDIALSHRRLIDAARRLQQAVAVQWSGYETALAASETALSLLSPENAMRRGYSIVYDKNHTIVTNAEQLADNTEVKLQFYRSDAMAVVKKRRPPSGSLL